MYDKIVLQTVQGRLNKFVNAHTSARVNFSCVAPFESSSEVFLPVH